MELNLVTLFFQVLNTVLLGALTFFIYRILKKKK